MPELIVIMLVVLMLFGSKRLPELARGLGKGIREFKRATNELKSELDVEPLRRDFEKEIKGNIDEVKNDLDESVQVGAKKPVRSIESKSDDSSDTGKQKSGDAASDAKKGE